jgi:hypothetical protein
VNDSRFYYHPLLRAYMRGYGLFGFVIALSLTTGPIATALRFVAGAVGFVYLYVTWHYGGDGVSRCVLTGSM